MSSRTGQSGPLGPVVVAATAALIVAVATKRAHMRRTARRATLVERRTTSAVARRMPAIDRLARQFASGEIGEAEFRRRSALLDSASP